MEKYTPYQTRYFAEQISLKRPQSSIDGLASAMSGVKVDLNPHQVDAALFALKSPLNKGALLADEVGLGKTIEAGLVLAQYWSERKRRILLIVPAALRTQWRAELSEKFFIDSCLLESSNFNKAKKDGILNPFCIADQVIICSYNFASRKAAEIKANSWDLIIMDEAHRLRNVYKPSNVTGKRLREALSGRKKLLLTATPLQNNLMELFGLVSIIDEHVFGDARTFRDMFVSVNNSDTRNFALKQRLKQFCNRTLRKQVTEYVRYTNRIAILQEYTPTEDEEKLYKFISEYLQSDKLYALPQGQRTLMTLVLRKLLASSSFAISGTLNSLITRLESLLIGIDKELSLDDYDTYDELNDEESDEDLITADFKKDHNGIVKELEQLKEYASLAASITKNSKGDNLLSALQQGFDKTEELGGQRKAVIFTESRRTQEYLLRLLSDNGYDGKIIFLNGTNNDDISKKIYIAWKERHKSDGKISGSRQADMKASIVEEFRDRASILIGTEAAAEGINLQFCSLIVNYDLPWNPQRIEQRIGRCHRYGQKNDVVVINFLNKKNAADVRVYELLDQKFRLFSGLFGSSDDVLGSIESGMDFEKRIAEIYQHCKGKNEIQAEFDQLQEELSEQINEKMTAARQCILENFDEEVAARLKGCQERTVAGLDRFSQWMFNFFVMHGAERVEPLEQYRLRYLKNGDSQNYNLKWQDAEKQGDIFLRRDDPLFKKWLDEAIQTPLVPASICFDYTNSNRNIGFLSAHPNLSGVLSVDKLIYSGYEMEEHLIFTIKTNDDTPIDDDMINRIMELPATVGKDCFTETAELAELRRMGINKQKTQIENTNKIYFLEECAKLDAYSEDLKDGLQQRIKELKKTINEKKKIFKTSASTNTLAEMIGMKEEINSLESKHMKMRREIDAEEDRIELENERLQDEIRSKLAGTTKTEHIMAFSFEIV